MFIIHNNQNLDEYTTIIGNNSNGTVYKITCGNSSASDTAIVILGVHSLESGIHNATNETIINFTKENNLNKKYIVYFIVPAVGPDWSFKVFLNEKNVVPIISTINRMYQ